MTEDRMRELFREMREEPVPADSLARVRMAVSERTERRATGWWWRFAAAVALAACALVVLFVTRMQDVPAAPVVAVARPGNPLASYTPPQPKPVVAPAVRMARKVEQRGPDVVIRIETPDPDVVLLLVGSE
ncbi:MAG: hypothetical protein HY820_18820 [Acidobacteria bacterium]|nr:hypothetical protein [Acidobacteriota bacterium]